MAQKVYLEPEDVRLMERAAANLRDALLIRLLFRLGCRISEVLALKREDIDFAQGTVTIRHLKLRSKVCCPECRTRLAKSARFCPGCGEKVTVKVAGLRPRHRQRVLPIDNDTLAMLKEYFQRGGPVVKGRKTLIFGINRHRAWQIVRDCAEKGGLPKLVNPETGRLHNVSPHRLRDAFAVHAVKVDDSGDGLRLLQEHLGHQSFNTTAKYRKISGKEHKDWYQRLWEKESQ